VRRRAGPRAQERITLEPKSPRWGEHRSRYHFGATRVRGRVVLDVASGTGFGSKIVADAGADLVIGAEIDWTALVDARPHTDDDLRFVQSDGTRLPVKSSRIDVVLSFETLEHVQEDEAFVAEIARVLKDDGVAFISTPNAALSPKISGQPANPFHVREYTAHELDRLLRKFFTEVHLRGQRVAPYYPVCPFWESGPALDDSVSARARVLLWKIQNRLPFQVKERLSRLLHNRAFFPGEYDFTFEEQGIEKAHVIVAECRP